MRTRQQEKWGASQRRAELLQLVYGITVEAWSYGKDSGMRPLQLTRELNDLGIGVMDQQARFQSCGPPLGLRMLKQGPWLFLWSLVPLTISGAACQIARDGLNFISVVSPRIAA